MNIEVRGIGFPNKGAELMLAALVAKIRDRFPEARIVLDPIAADFHLRARYGTYQLAKFVKFGINIASVFSLLPKKLRIRFGVILKSEIDVVIDASGFAYGDQWGAEKINERLPELANASTAKTSNTKIVLMPQALGPFTSEAIKKAMLTVINGADLVFARDSQSLQYITSIKTTDTIGQAPDFTNVYRCAYAGEFSQENNQVCFIPNAKMLEMKKGSDNAYADFMASLVKLAFDQGLKPFLLIHEGNKDKKLGEDILAKAGVTIPVYQPDTAEDVKAIIGLAKIVVSSRFHGLVSALSQGVPVIATGWSHKYQKLLADYGVESYLYDENTDLPAAQQSLMALGTDDSHYIATKSRIERQSAIQKQYTDAMWETVFNLLER